MQKEKGEVVGKILVGILVITVVLLFVGIIVFGFIGLMKVWSSFGLMKVSESPSIFSNVLYFGGLLFGTYLILLCIEMMVKLGIKLLNVTQSLAKTILLYAVQFIFGTLAIKLLIDNLFHRIDVSLFAVSVSVAILYVIVFFSSGAHKGKDDLWDV